MAIPLRFENSAEPTLYIPLELPGVEIVSVKMDADGYHITAPEPTGVGASLAIQRALDDAGVTPEQVEYINAHEGLESALRGKLT